MLKELLGMTMKKSMKKTIGIFKDTKNDKII